MSIEIFNIGYLERVTAKDLSLILGISLSCANRYLKDIKNEFKIKLVCYCHVVNYFKFSYIDSQNYYNLLKTIKKHEKKTSY